MSDTAAKKRGGETDCTAVVERLRILGQVLQAMRFATPGGSVHHAPVAKLSIPRAHDRMVTEFILLANHWGGGLVLDFPVNKFAEDGTIELVVEWKGQKDAGVS